jgi:energy-coupling factor transporter transmembrane protein EcfT
MSAVVSWITGILAMVVIGTILDIFLSEKKLGKVIRSVIASLIVLMIISPLPALFTGLKSCTFQESDVTLDTDYLDYANKIKVRSLENGLADALDDKGYKNVGVEISAEVGMSEISISVVRLDISEMSLDIGIPNINKAERVKQLTAEFLKISSGKIMVLE